MNSHSRQKMFELVVAGLSKIRWLNGRVVLSITLRAFSGAAGEKAVSLRLVICPPYEIRSITTQAHGLKSSDFFGA
jgi:hypothetical protein